MGEQPDIDIRGDAVFTAAEEERRRNQVVIRLLLAAMLFGVVSTFVHFYASNSLQTDIRQVVRSQIPALEEQVATRNQTIADQQSVLQNQCIPAIVTLSEQVRDLGGTPKPVVLKPPERKR